ncbi:hypothetical protein IMZ48_41705 [Candidatus Bathyarchaeota archaeon]|nr:hypothetical protein [Candidatus Bathyarchaeota archaeon]
MAQATPPTTRRNQNQAQCNAPTASSDPSRPGRIGAIRQRHRRGRTSVLGDPCRPEEAVRCEALRVIEQLLVEDTHVIASAIKTVLSPSGTCAASPSQLNLPPCTSLPFNSTRQSPDNHHHRPCNPPVPNPSLPRGANPCPERWRTRVAAGRALFRAIAAPSLVPLRGERRRRKLAWPAGVASGRWW